MYVHICTYIRVCVCVCKMFIYHSYTTHKKYQNIFTHSVRVDNIAFPKQCLLNVLYISIQHDLIPN